jgi:HlyD family secretion protein
MVAAGLPIATLVDVEDAWAVFYVREDRLPGLAIGTRLSLAIPALGLQGEAFEITSVAPEADYATWRPTSSQGGFDLKTFELRARPVRRIPGLRPGMSVTRTLAR